LAHGEASVTTLRCGGMALSMEAGAQIAAVAALHSRNMEEWQWSGATAAAQVLLLFETWFSRDGKAPDTRLKVILGILQTLHVAQLFLLHQGIEETCKTLFVQVVLAAAVVGLGIFSFPLNLLPEYEVPKPVAAAKAATPTVRPGDTPNTVEGQLSPMPRVISAPTVQVENPSALRENIEKKKELSYYFAHSKPATVENINRGGDPVRLAGTESIESTKGHALTSIRKYAFSDGKSSVSIYLDLPALGFKRGDIEYTIDFTKTSLRVVLAGTHLLNIPKLKYEIASAKGKLSSGKDRLSIALKKVESSKTWDALT